MRALIIALTMLLAACTSSGQVTPQSVIDFVKANCNAVVQVADIAALITANPAIASAATLGDQICKAINAQRMAEAKSATPSSGGVVVVDNVPVHWTNKE
jgi:hypothetical protein